MNTKLETRRNGQIVPSPNRHNRFVYRLCRARGRGNKDSTVVTRSIDPKQKLGTPLLRCCASRPNSPHAIRTQTGSYHEPLFSLAVPGLKPIQGLSSTL